MEKLIKEIENNDFFHIEPLDDFRILINKLIEEKRLDFSLMVDLLPFVLIPNWHQVVSPVNLTKKHVQIFPINSHCYWVYYSPNEGLQIFDSAYDQSGGHLPDDLEKFLQRMYPGVDWWCVKPATLQPDNYSCAIFSMIYTLLLLNDEDPGKHTFDTTDMKKLRQNLSNKVREIACDIQNKINSRYVIKLCIVSL